MSEPSATDQEKPCERDHHQNVEDPPRCPWCSLGHVVERHGKHGKFYGCCRYPTCEFTCDVYDANQMYDPDPNEPYFGM